MPILTLGGLEPCMQWAKLMLSLKVKPDAEEMCDEKQTATVKSLTGRDLTCTEDNVIGKKVL